MAVFDDLTQAPYKAMKYVYLAGNTKCNYGGICDFCKYGIFCYHLREAFRYMYSIASQELINIIEKEDQF